MRLILSPKDAGPKIVLPGVYRFAQEGETLVVVFKDGRRRNYPHRHLWHWEWIPDRKPKGSA